jgi:5-methylcytosine-specific restriction protein A
MPTKPLSPCKHPACPDLTAGRFCVKHQKQHSQQEDSRRGSARERGYTSRWERARAHFLFDHPFCECELHNGMATAPLATVVDHVQPHRGDMDLFWNTDNWQALSKHCHSVKTAREDGGYGNIS